MWTKFGVHRPHVHPNPSNTIIVDPPATNNEQDGQVRKAMRGIGRLGDSEWHSRGNLSQSECTDQNKTIEMPRTYYIVFRGIRSLGRLQEQIFDSMIHAAENATQKSTPGAVAHCQRDRQKSAL